MERNISNYSLLFSLILIFVLINTSLSLEYVIGVDDILSIDLWRDSDMSGEWIVKENGNINYPLLGEIKLAGLTIDEAQDKLTELLKEYYRDPQVNLTISEYGSCEVYVLGEVENPGIINYSREASVLEVVLKAGGFTKNSRKNSTVVIRNIDEEAEIYRIDLDKVIGEGLIALNINIEPGDIVYVPSTYISDLNQFLANISPAMSSYLRIHSIYKLEW
jgi:polysaccharide export outer membrane protein